MQCKRLRSGKPGVLNEATARYDPQVSDPVWGRERERVRGADDPLRGQARRARGQQSQEARDRCHHQRREDGDAGPAARAASMRDARHEGGPSPGDGLVVGRRHLREPVGESVEFARQALLDRGKRLPQRRPRAAKPRAHRPDRYLERLRDLLVGELRPREQENHVPIAFTQAKESVGQRRVQPISRHGPIRPISIHRPRIRGKPPKLRAPMVADNVDGDPEQRWARILAAEVIARSPANVVKNTSDASIVGEHDADTSSQDR